MSNSLFPLQFGPKGRSISIDANGRLVSTNEQDTDLLVYGFGTTGRPLVVDASGRLIISPLSVNVAPSGWDLPQGNFGDFFYHLESGYFRKGIDYWEQQTTPEEHSAMLWLDTTPETGEILSLSTAQTFYVFDIQSPSGGQTHGHGLFVHSSGILIQDVESEGHYIARYSISFTGSTATTFYGAIFVDDEEIRASKFARTIGTASQVGNVGGQAILSVASGNNINMRFASNFNSKQIEIQVLNLTINRAHQH